MILSPDHLSKVAGHVWATVTLPCVDGASQESDAA